LKIAILAHAGSVHTRRWSAGLAMRGHEIQIISNSAFLANPDEIKTHLLPGKTSLSYFRNIPRVKKIIRHFAPDIVHAHYATGYGLWGYTQKTAPMIVSVWGTDIADALEGRMIITPIVRRTLQTARFVTATSKFLIDQILRFEPSVGDKLVHIPFGVQIKAAETGPSKSDDVVRVIFAKQYHSTYAPELVLRAFAAAVRKKPNMALTLIGGGPLHEKLNDLSRKLGLESHVEIRGWIDMFKAESLIAQSDIMVMPSNRESFGVAALEACASGVPVIATNVGGIPEIIENGRNGILIEPGDEQALTDALIKLADDPKLRRQMGEAGKKIARENYDFDKSLDLMEQLYRRMISS